MPDERKWYVVQTYSGYEKHVMADIEQRRRNMGMEDKIFRVLVPIEEYKIYREGKPARVATRKLYPSYVMVEMILDEQSWYAVRHTPGVTGFIGAGNHPKPLSDDEVERLMAAIEKKDDDKMRVEMDIKPGDAIQVEDEDIGSYSGKVTSVNPKKGTVRFKREGFSGDIEADYTSVRKI